MSVKSYYESYWIERASRHRGELIEPLRNLFETTISPSAKVLDAGCGDGWPSGVWLNEHAAEYVGVDISEPGVAACKELGLDARLIEDLAELPFEDNSFDNITCVEVMEHLFAPYDAARELLRVLRPGGRLIATVPNIAYWRRRADMAVLGRWNPVGDLRSTKEPWRDPHIRFFARRNFAAMLQAAGFDPVEVGGHGGTLVGDIPGLRKLVKNHGGLAHEAWRAHPLYAPLERTFPGLLGYRLHAVATKPAG
jgi:methionine biosynthesis protein MetW